MTRTIPIDFSNTKPVFDFTQPAKDFACTGQRAAILVTTLRGSAPLFPDAGTKLPAIPGTMSLTAPGKLRAEVLNAQEAVNTNLKANPTPYPYEHCSTVKMAPLRDGPTKASVGMVVYSREGIYYGNAI